MKLLSIIIPHYNNPVLLDKLLQSIPIMEEVEVIVVDDQSDNKCEKYKELTLAEKNSSIIFVDNYTEKKGAGVARNIGLDKATGKWVLFADADDYFVPGFYSIVEKYFETNYDVVFFKLASVFLDSGQTAERHFFYNKLIDEFLAIKNMKQEMALRYFHNPPVGKLINREIILKNNLQFDEVIASNDVMFSARLGYHMKRFTADKNVIYCATRGRGSLTMNIDEHIYDTRLNVFINYYNYLHDILPKEQFKVLSLSGWGKVVDVFKYRLGLKKILSVICKLKRNRIRLLDIRFLNPVFFGEKLFSYIKRYNSEKKYMGKG